MSKLFSNLVDGGPFGGSCQIHGPVVSGGVAGGGCGGGGGGGGGGEADGGDGDGDSSPVLRPPAFPHANCPPVVHRTCFCVRFIAEHTKMLEDSTKVCIMIYLYYSLATTPIHLVSVK